MKKMIIMAAITAGLLNACKKSDAGTDETTITASATQVSSGVPVSFSVSTPKNAISWTVTPSAAANKQYSITDKKTNVISFNQAGTYTVSVRARDIVYDSVAHHNNIDSCWHHGGGNTGGCRRGKDSASVTIKVI